MIITDLLFLSENAKQPVTVSVNDENVNKTGLLEIMYSVPDENGLIKNEKKNITPEEYGELKRITTKKFITETVSLDKTNPFILATSVPNTNYLQVLEDIKNHQQPINRLASQEYTEDMKKVYKMCMDAENIDLEPIAKNTIETIIEFMKTLTDGDKDKFYADIRSRIDSEFYGKVVISKEDYENFKKYEKIINEIKEQI